MNVKNIIIGGLVVAILGGLAYVMHDKFEKVSEEIDVGFKGEARSNSLYASRLFLKAMGIPAESINLYQLDKLPSKDTVIVINTQRTTLSTQRIDNLLDWVQQGGHLLTIVAPDYLGEDVLQRRLNITTNHVKHSVFQQEKEDDTNNQTNNKNNDADDDDNSDDDNPMPVTLTKLEKQYQLNITRFSPIYSKEKREERVNINDTTFLVNRPYGTGTVSLIADLKFAENEMIDQYDHAEFFWQLIHRHHSTPSNIWLLNSDDMPPLWQWLWQYASAFIISVSLLVFFWFYRLAQRFGPLIPHRELDRRRILEHIQASGHFLWKQDQQQLIHSSRESVQQKFETLFPAWNQLEQDEQLKYASEHSQLTTDELRHLLYEEKKLSVDEFIRLIQQLEKLRKN